MSELGVEPQAFLAGEVAHCLDEAGEEVPVWAWINAVAHATPEQLARMAAGDTGRWRRRRARHQARALSHLADRMLAYSGANSERLADLQREVLMQFESALAGAPKERPVMAPHRLVSTGRRLPDPVVGRNLGNGRLNRALLVILGPAQVTRPD
ncbi:MAG TPA: hypothetical protein VE990_06815 [Acidimicrobiales bacterium]|nr:hypothetical protein [Acidimicrobiales bacterium]